MTDGPRPRRRRSWPQRLLISFNILIVLVCFTSAGGLAYLFKQTTDIQRVGGLSTLDQSPAKGEPQNFLLVGVDNAQGIDPHDPILIGRNQASKLSDTIMIVRVDPTTRQASILSLPRDLYVPIADIGIKSRINNAISSDAFSGGGPDRLIKTIQQDFAIPINHYVEVNFAAFRTLVDAINGISIYFPWAARDVNTGFGVDQPGCTVLNGDEALRYARSRYFEIKQGSRWVSDPTSDFGRISRQQQFIKLALKRAISKGARNPFVLTQLIGVAQRNMQLDDRLTTKDLLDLASQFRDFDPDNIKVSTPPAVPTTIGGASVVILDQAAAQAVFEPFRGRGDPSDPRRSILVQVRNGSGHAGQGQDVLRQVSDAGFTSLDASDASSFGNSRTEIRYAPGNETSAVELARSLDGTPQLTPDKTLVGSTLVLVTGREFTALRSSPRPASDFDAFLATTTTTSPTATTPGDTVTSASDGSAKDAFVPRTPDGEVCG